MTRDVEHLVATAFQDSWGQIVATLIGITDDWDLAEECAQDAFTAALESWPRKGVPDVPGAWLTSVARNRATDVLRRRALGAAKLTEVAVNSRDGDVEPLGPDDIDEAAVSGVQDDRLRLIFTCCHPALAPEAQIALIAASIAEFGFNNPILVDTKAGIIAGHGRLLAARKRQLTEVPVIVLDHLTDAQKRAYVIADNQLALDAGWV